MLEPFFFAFSHANYKIISLKCFVLFFKNYIIGIQGNIGIIITSK